MLSPQNKKSHGYLWYAVVYLNSYTSGQDIVTGLDSLSYLKQLKKKKRQNTSDNSFQDIEWTSSEGGQW